MMTENLQQNSNNSNNCCVPLINLSYRLAILYFDRTYKNIPIKPKKTENL